LRFRSIKLPGGMRGIADGEPGVANDVVVGGNALHFASLEVERVFSDQECGIGAAFQLYRAVSVVENAVSRSDIQDAVVALEMLILKSKRTCPRTVASEVALLYCAWSARR